MGALREENTTCNSKIHLHKSSLSVLRCTIYTPRTDKQIRLRDSGRWEGVRCKCGEKEEERKKRGMRGRCFTLDGSLSVPATESGIKCCLDWSVDKNSSLSEHRLYQVGEKCGRWMVLKKRREREREDEWGEERRKGMKRKREGET